MKILFSHKLMGIVVSSRQASNIFWHSVTRLNAICVLISSLQPPRPLEERGVRWFSLFHSLLCLSSFLNTISSLLLSHSLSFCSFLFHYLLQLYQRASREDSFHQTVAVSIFFVPLSVILCQNIDRSAARRIGRLPVHPYYSVPVPRDPGVQHASLLSF